MARGTIEIFKKDLLSLKTIGLDSMVFIYQFADDPRYARLTNIVFEYAEKGKINTVTSSISVAEVFVQPEKEKDNAVIGEYEKVFQNLPNFEILPLDWHTARLTSKLRAKYPHIKTPDAIQIAGTLLKGYAGFLTNDSQRKQVREIKVLVMEEYVS